MASKDKTGKSKRVEKKAAAKEASAAAAPSEKTRAKRPVKKAAQKQAAPAAPAAKRPAKKASKPAPAKKRYNAGPERGDNSFPPSNKGNKGFNSHGATGPAADSSSGPGGVTKQGRGRGENVGGNVRKSKD